MDTEENELVTRLDDFDPRTDTGRALKFFYKLYLQDRERVKHVAEVLDRHAAADKAWIASQEAAERKKHSLVKACRDALSKLVGDIDTHVLKK